MTNQNVLDTLTNLYSSLTKSGRKIADFIFANKVESQYMSITSLAEEVGVAEATVSRFCKNLGYSGYNEFKLALAKESGTTNEYDEGSYSRISPDDSISEMAKKLYSLNTLALQQSLNLLVPEDISNAARLINDAVKVFCFGQGGSGVLAREAWARFITTTPKFICIDDSHMQTLTASLSGEDDLILFFSYSGATKDAIDTLRLAKKRNAKVILVTHYPKSPAAVLADIILLCGSRESPLLSGSIAAKMAQLFIIDILFQEYCRQYPQAIENRENTSVALASKLL